MQDMPHPARTRSYNSDLADIALAHLGERLLSRGMPFVVCDNADFCRVGGMYMIYVNKRHRFVVAVLCVAGADMNKLSVNYHAVEDKVVCNLMPIRPDIPHTAVYRTPKAAQDAFLEIVEEVLCVHMQMHVAARVLQRAWRLAIADPRFEACKKRLMREFGDDKISLQTHKHASFSIISNHP